VLPDYRNLARGVIAALAIAASLFVHTASAHAIVDFKTPKNAADCFTDEYNGNHFGCYTPNDGFFVRMSTNSRVTKSYEPGLRNNYDRYYGRVLRYGQSARFGSRGQFRCTSLASGLTCTNRRGHGWRLGVFVGYNLF
jgi:hypothetical protein